MSRSKNNVTDEFEGDDDFVESEQNQDAEFDAAEQKRAQSRHSWKRLEEMKDEKLLRAQIADWDDWQDLRDSDEY